MFTGIITAIGTVRRVERRGAGRRIVVDAADLQWDGLREGASVATSGICLTAIKPDAGRFAADLSEATCAITTAGAWQPGTRVNLERALRLGDELGGHLVSGHIDGTAQVLQAPDAASPLRLRLPDALMPMVAVKGSLAVDGISLTVAAIGNCDCEFHIVPHSLHNTTLQHCARGDDVNIETDMVARHLARLAAPLL